MLLSMVKVFARFETGYAYKKREYQFGIAITWKHPWQLTATMRDFLFNKELTA